MSADRSESISSARDKSTLVAYGTRRYGALDQSFPARTVRLRILPAPERLTVAAARRRFNENDRGNEREGFGGNLLANRCEAEPRENVHVRPPVCSGYSRRMATPMMIDEIQRDSKTAIIRDVAERSKTRPPRRRPEHAWESVRIFARAERYRSSTTMLASRTVTVTKGGCGDCRKISFTVKRRSSAPSSRGSPAPNSRGSPRTAKGLAAASERRSAKTGDERPSPPRRPGSALRDVAQRRGPYWTKTSSARTAGATNDRPCVACATDCTQKNRRAREWQPTLERCTDRFEEMSAAHGRRRHRRSPVRGARMRPPHRRRGAPSKDDCVCDLPARRSRPRIESHSNCPTSAR